MSELNDALHRKWNAKRYRDRITDLEYALAARDATIQAIKDAMPEFLFLTSISDMPVVLNQIKGILAQPEPWDPRKENPQDYDENGKPWGDRDK